MCKAGCMYLIGVLLLIIAHLLRSCRYGKWQNSVSAVLNFLKAMMRLAPYSCKSSVYRPQLIAAQFHCRSPSSSGCDGGNESKGLLRRVRFKLTYRQVLDLSAVAV